MISMVYQATNLATLEVSGMLQIREDWGNLPYTDMYVSAQCN